LEVSLDGKVAIVTGTGPNIGSGIALALARYGAKVACNDLSFDVAKAAVARVERNGGTGLALAGDVSVEEDAVSNLSDTLKASGRIISWLTTPHGCTRATFSRTAWPTSTALSASP
jgi:NAD(P)-dependent dehydrogenase (short-subunit alcohol dehydrogenase family)